jgi:hypothetical protein
MIRVSSAKMVAMVFAFFESFEDYVEGFCDGGKEDV